MNIDLMTLIKIFKQDKKIKPQLQKVILTFQAKFPLETYVIKVK